MTTKKNLYEESLKHRGVPLDVTRLVSEYVQLEPIRKEFEKLVKEMYKDIFPVRFIDTDKMFDEAIKSLYSFMRTNSIKKFIQQNFWELYYSVDRIYVDRNQLEDNEKIFLYLVYEFKLDLYKRVFTPFQRGDFKKYDDYVVNKYGEVFLLLLDGLFDQEDLPIDITFDEFRKLYPINNSLGPQIYWTRDIEEYKLNTILKSLGLVDKFTLSDFYALSREDKYRLLKEYHDKNLQL